MTAYTTVQDVQNRIVIGGFQITATSKPSEAAVTRWIEEASAQVDAALRRAGYPTPVTHEGDRTLIGGAVANMVALRTLYMAFGPDVVDAGIADTLGGWREFLNDIRQGALDLETTSASEPHEPTVITVTRKDGYHDTHSEYGG